MKCPVCLFVTWEWLKKYWAWLIVPVGAAIWLLGRLSAKKQVTITSTALEEADAAKKGIDAEADAKVDAADAKMEAQLSGVAAAHSADVAATTQKQLNAVAAAQGNPEAVNSLLLDVGKGMRQ